jgi:single-strand DNA-binding protein
MRVLPCIFSTYLAIVFFLILIKEFFMAMMLIQVAGNLGADPESRISPSGQKVTTFRIACNVRRKGTEKTVWWRVTIFGDRFDKLIPYLKKGSSVFVFGSLNPPEIYQDREGNPQVSCELIAEYISFLPSARPADRQNQETPAQETEAVAYAPGAPARPSFGGLQPGNMPQQDVADDEVPF